MVKALELDCWDTETSETFMSINMLAGFNLFLIRIGIKDLLLVLWLFWLVVVSFVEYNLVDK